jgi:uncharacterized membrane protein YccC
MPGRRVRQVSDARTSLTGLLRDAARLDRTQSDPVVAARNALGVAAPLAVGVLLGNVALGLAAAIGALQTAFADRPGPYRLRMVRMLGTATAAGVTSGLAVLASRNDAAAVSLLLVLAFAAGLLLSGGPAATQVGVAGVAAAIILGHLQQPPSAALHVALLVVVGGAGQAALAIVAWPLRRHRPERVALARLYRELATAARIPQGTRSGPPASTTLTEVRQTLYGLGHDHGPSVEAYRVLLDEAERIRREIVVIIGLAERLAAKGNPILAGLVRESCTATGGVLDEIAAALTQARPVDDAIVARARDVIAFAVRRLRESVDAPAERSRLATAARLRALAGQLRAAVESTRTGASEGGRGGGRDETRAGLRDRVATLRSSLAPDSAVLRHATRVAVLVAGSDLVVRLLHLDRGYWVSLTVLVVLRPDFGATLQRSVMRTVGTIVGLLVSSEIVRFLPGGGWWQIALIALLVFGMRLAGPGNIALSAVALSGLVVVLLEINGVPAHQTVLDRALATLAGGALAVVASVALPAWERRYVPERLAALLDAYRDYVLAVADLGADRATMHRTRAAARVARTNAQASVDRAQAEPVGAEAEIELGRAVLAHTHRFIHAALAVDALRVPIREAGGLPELAEFLTAAGQALAAAQALVEGRPEPSGAAPLRPLQERVVDALAADPDGTGGVESLVTLVDATDRLTNSLDTLLDELRRQTASAG